MQRNDHEAEDQMHATRRTPALILLALLTGCSSTNDASLAVPTSAPSPTAHASASPLAVSPSAAVPSPSTATTASATPSGPTGAYAWGDLLEVTGDGLALRLAPSTSGAIVMGSRWDADRATWVPTAEEVRLRAGDVVRVALGPIERESFTWYRVFEDPSTAEPIDGDLGWDANQDGVTAFEQGWIANARGEERYVEALSDPLGPNWNLPLVFAAGSSRTFESEPFQASIAIRVDYALVTGNLAPCDLTITLETLGEVLVDTSLIGMLEEGEVMSSTELPEGDYTVVVTAGVPGSPEAPCGWAISVGQVIG